MQSADNARMLGRYFPLALFLCCKSTSRCGGPPTAPDRHGSPVILVTCTSATASSLNCTAPVSCSLYPCLPGTPPDVTASATWTTDDPSVARVAAEGTLVAVGPGYTTVRAVTSGVSEGFRAVAVYPGTPPLPVFGLQGTVREGASPNDVKIDGATIQVLDGLIAGRIWSRGVPPAAVPAFLPGARRSGTLHHQRRSTRDDAASRDKGRLSSVRARRYLYALWWPRQRRFPVAASMTRHRRRRCTGSRR